MKRLIPATVLVLAMTAPLFAGLGEKILLVKQSDRKGHDTYSLMSDEEYDEVEDEIKAEARLHMKAMMAVQREWRKAEDTARKTFPRSAVKVRKIRVIQTYRDNEKANDKLGYYMEKEARAAEKKAERNRHRGRRGRSERAREREARKEAREAEKEALEEQARQMYENKLTELLQGKSNENAAPAADAQF